MATPQLSRRGLGAGPYFVANFPGDLRQFDYGALYACGWFLAIPQNLRELIKLDDLNSFGGNQAALRASLREIGYDAEDRELDPEDGHVLSRAELLALNGGEEPVPMDDIAKPAGGWPDPLAWLPPPDRDDEEDPTYDPRPDQIDPAWLRAFYGKYCTGGAGSGKTMFWLEFEGDPAKRTAIDPEDKTLEELIELINRDRRPPATMPRPLAEV